MTATAGITLARTPDNPSVAGPDPAGRHIPGTNTVRSDRFWDLEGMRGLAALLIVVFHAYQFCRGTNGTFDWQGSVFFNIFLNLAGLVGVFFALSAFVLWRPMVDRVMRGEPAANPRQWVVRRAVRIIPLYYAVIVIVWATRNPHFPGDWHDLVEHLTFTFVFDNKRIFYTDGPAWSVAIEVMFYALLALFAWFLVRRAVHTRSRRRRWVMLSLPLPLLLVVGPAWSYWTDAIRHIPITSWSAYFGPLAWTTSFGCGMLLAMLHVRHVHRGRPPLPAWANITMRIAALVIFFVASAYPAATPESLTVFRLASGVSAALLLGSGVFAPPSSLWRRVLGSPVLLFTAVISYSLYLWHEPVLLMMDSWHILPHASADFPIVAAILVAASVPVAYLSYRFIERPAGFLRYLWESRRPTDVAPEPRPPAVPAPAPA